MLSVAYVIHLFVQHPPLNTYYYLLFFNIKMFTNFFFFKLLFITFSQLFWNSRGGRADTSLVPPIRQTASIFKQPVTVHRNHESKVKSDLKHGSTQEKPKQLFWEKRLEVSLHSLTHEKSSHF